MSDWVFSALELAIYVVFAAGMVSLALYEARHEKRAPLELPRGDQQGGNHEC